MFSTKVWCITSLVSSGQRHDGWGFILSLSVYRAKMRKSVVIYTRSYEEPQWSFLLDAVIPSSFPSFASSPSKKSSQLIVHKINWRFKATMQLDFWWMCWCCVTLNVKLFDRLEIFLNSPRFSSFFFLRTIKSTMEIFTTWPEANLTLIYDHEVGGHPLMTRSRSSVTCSV